MLRKDVSGESSVYIVVLGLREQQAADDLFLSLNGKPFTPLEPDVICRLGFVKELIIGAPEEDARPPAGTCELPSCPVCLERLDEHVTGIVTTICNHRFHHEARRAAKGLHYRCSVDRLPISRSCPQCLIQWGDTKCPVCRQAVCDYDRCPRSQPDQTMPSLLVGIPSTRARAPTATPAAPAATSGSASSAGTSGAVGMPPGTPRSTGARQITVMPWRWRPAGFGTI